MTAKEIREIAENVVIEGLDNHFQEYIDMANYILANVQEDGEEVVDAIWLEREYRFKQYEDFWYIHTDTCEMKYYYDGIYADHQKLIHKPTRSQFRALCKGLGIESQKGKT